MTVSAATAGSAGAADAAVTMRVEGMDCGACAIKIENALKRLPGVSDINVSYATQTLGLRLDEDRTSRDAIHFGEVRNRLDVDVLLRTAIGQPSDFAVPGEASGRSQRVRPGDPDHSALAVRLASRNAVRQMPPLGTQIVDEEAVRLVRQWIADDLGTRHAGLAPRKENQR
jgi:copper chaperone CopZ